MAHNNYSGGFLSPRLNYEDLGYEEALEIIDGFYPSPELPPSHELRRTPLPHNNEAPELPAATDEEFATLMEDIEAMEGIETVDHFQLPPEDAHTHLEPLEANRQYPNPYIGATPPNNPDAITRPHNSDPPVFSMGTTNGATPAGAATELVAPPSSSNRSDLQAEMRHEEINPISSSRSAAAPIPFSISRVKGGASTKRAASSSPLATKQPQPKKAKIAVKTVSSPLMNFADIPTSLSPSAQLRSPSQGVVEPPKLEIVAPAKSEERKASASPMKSDSDLEDTPAPLPNKKTIASRRSVSAAASAMTGPRRTRSDHSSAIEGSAEAVEGTAKAIKGPAKAAKGAKPKGLPRATSSSNTRSKGAQRADSTPDATELQTMVNTKVPDGGAKPAARHRRPLGTNELKDLMGTDALTGLHAGKSPQRLTRQQKLERTASQPGASTKAAVKMRRQGKKK